MPADSFESPLTLAASGGHYELAALLISRGADLEEVNDEGSVGGGGRGEGREGWQVGQDYLGCGGFLPNASLQVALHE